MQNLIFPPLSHILSPISTFFLPLNPSSPNLYNTRNPPRYSSRKCTGFLPRHSSTLPEKKREEIPENTVFLGFLRGQGRKGKDLKEKKERRRENGSESLSGGV